MKTKGGLKVTNFRKIKDPVKDSNLEPLIYKGLVKKITYFFPSDTETTDNFDSLVKWDKDGKCRNRIREDCDINVSDIPAKALT
jgi:hypothetical protein